MVVLVLHCSFQVQFRDDPTGTPAEFKESCQAKSLDPVLDSWSDINPCSEPFSSVKRRFDNPLADREICIFREVSRSCLFFQ